MVSEVEASFGFTCLPVTFKGSALLRDWELRSANVISNAEFVLDGVVEDPGCGAPPLLTYRGQAPPNLEVGTRYEVELQFNTGGRRDSNAAIALSDEAGVLVAWFWQATELLPDVSFASALNLQLSTEAACKVSDGCVTSRAYNRLKVRHGIDSVKLEIGQSYDFQEGSERFVLGVNGGTWRHGPLSPGCADEALGDDIVFAILRR